MHAGHGVRDRREACIHHKESLTVHKTFYSLFFTRSATTEGSASVLVSPRLLTSFAATFLRMRRMIFPLRLLGRPSAHWIFSGVAIGPMMFRTCATSSFFNASDFSTPVLSVT